jgi:hypothetical protein
VTDEELLRSLAADVENKDIEAFVSKCHADVEFEPLIGSIEGGVYRGHDAIRRWWVQRERALNIALGELDIRQVAGVHLLTVAMRARGSGSGAPVVGALYIAMSVRHGKVEWWAVFQNEDAAVRRAEDWSAAR